MSNIINEDDKIITDRILNALSSNNIQNYLINTVITTSDESFYVLKNNVLSRNKYTVKSTVTIYNDFDDENNKYRGSFSFTADLNMDEEELSSRALNAYNSAGAVKNPYYPLPLGNSMFLENNKSDSFEIPMNLDSSRHIADIILGCEYTSSVINSTEVFVTTKYNHTINSNGVNVKYSTSTYEGEYVAQSKEKEDVELYNNFKFASTDSSYEDSLKSMVTSSLKSVYDRSFAVSYSDFADNIKFDKIILTGNCLYDLFNCYVSRSDASMIYPQYSDYSIGGSIISDSSNEKLSITVLPKTPYSSEGVKRVPLNIIKDNKIQYITGNSRFSHYLSLPATGNYDCFSLKCGTSSFDSMKSGKYLMIEHFSDFQMDNLNGQFGGEFRLAYVSDGTNVTPVTKGSVSFDIDKLRNLVLSSDEQNFYNYQGPVAISFDNQ